MNVTRYWQTVLLLKIKYKNYNGFLTQAPLLTRHTPKYAPAPQVPLTFFNKQVHIPIQVDYSTAQRHKYRGSYC